MQVGTLSSMRDGCQPMFGSDISKVIGREISGSNHTVIQACCMCDMPTMRTGPVSSSIACRYYMNLETVRSLRQLNDEVGDGLVPIGSCTRTVLKVSNELVSSRMK